MTRTDIDHSSSDHYAEGLKETTLVRLREGLANFPAPLERALNAQVGHGRSARRPEPGVRTTLTCPNHKLRPDEVDALVACYEAGTAINELARQFRVDKETARLHLQKREVRLRPQRVMTDVQAARAVELYLAGATLRQLGTAFGIATTSIRNYLHRAGITLRPARRTPRAASSPDVRPAARRPWPAT